MNKKIAEKYSSDLKKKVEKIVGNIFGEIIGLIIGLIIWVYVGPRLPFITETYGVWLPIGIGTAVMSSVIKIWKHLTPKPIKYFLEALSIIPSLFSVYKLIEIFPFDFSLIDRPMFNDYLKLAFYVAIFGMSVAIIVNMVKMVGGFGDMCVKKENK